MNIPKGYEYLIPAMSPRGRCGLDNDELEVAAIKFERLVRACRQRKLLNINAALVAEARADKAARGKE